MGKAGTAARDVSHSGRLDIFTLTEPGIATPVGTGTGDSPAVAFGPGPGWRDAGTAARVSRSGIFTSGDIVVEV